MELSWHISITRRSKPKAIPPWGGAPVLRALQQKPEFVLVDFGGHAEDLEYPGLQVVVVDTDAAAADFKPIEDQVVGP
jgi:hypothetical protein